MKSVLGITGGIGSGKSYISALLHTMGVPVYDCDSEAKRLIAGSSEIRQALTALVGNDIYEGTHLVRERLAQYLFANADHAGRVNAIVHPVVLHDFRKWTMRQGTPIVAMESAILYESGFHAHVDKVLFVDAPETVRLHRAMQRSGATEQQVRERMKLQHTETNRPLADYVIDNYNQSDRQLISALRSMINDLCSSQSDATT